MRRIIPFSVELTAEVVELRCISTFSAPPSGRYRNNKRADVIDGMNLKVLKEQSLRGMGSSSGLMQRGLE